MSEKLNLLVDGARGVYVPQSFAVSHTTSQAIHGYPSYVLRVEDLAVLVAGPDHEDYWECWNSVLDAAERKDDEGRTWHLEYNDCGDLMEVRDDYEEDE